MGAVIDRNSFKKLAGYLEETRRSSDAQIIAGGEVDDSIGYFVRPTLIQAKKPDYRTMCEELFGPVVTLYVYPEKEWHSTLELMDRTSPYALTGAVFSTDRAARTIQSGCRIPGSAAGSARADRIRTAGSEEIAPPPAAALRIAMQTAHTSAGLWPTVVRSDSEKPQAGSR